MSNIKNISDNQLSECLCYLYEVKDSLEGDFCHIEDDISKTFQNSLNKELTRFQDEDERRATEE